jgi:DNA-binding NtrC family response regulator
LTIQDPPSQPATNGNGDKPTLHEGQSLANLVDDVERTVIADTMMRFSGNISESARILGLTRRGLYLKLRRLGFESGAILDTK